MAEGQNDKKVYFTRLRKRSMDNAGKSTGDVEIEEDCVVIDSVKEEPVIDLTEDDSDQCDTKSLECAICLQNCIHPARLPCGHVFCFLCVKGAAHGNKKCAMCRSPIPHNYFHNPDLLETPEEIADVNHEGYEWFYEGRQGWWQYDPRASAELEKAWESGAGHCELLIAGFLYTIDIKEMYQARKGQPSKRRKIKRDLANCEKLGVAGLRDPNALPRRLSEGDKGRHDDDYHLDDLSPELERRSSLDSSVYYFSGLEEQFADLSLNNSDDDDSYQ